MSSDDWQGRAMRDPGTDPAPDNTSSVNPVHARLLRYFAYEHLPEPLQAISAPFCELARVLADDSGITDPAELTVALRKLLESKDAAVRAHLPLAGA